MHKIVINIGDTKLIHGEMRPFLYFTLFVQRAFNFFTLSILANSLLLVLKCSSFYESYRTHLNKTIIKMSATQGFGTEYRRATEVPNINDFSFIFFMQYIIITNSLIF